MFKKITHYIQTHRQARRGSVAIMAGLMMIVLIGMVALGTEIVYLLMAQRQMQVAADAAALGAATAKATGYPANFRTEALAIASAAGYTSGANSVTVTVNNPPTTGNYTSDTSTIEVIVDQPQVLSMVSLFRSGTFDVAARAVAKAGSAGQYCALALDGSASGSITVSNNATLTNSKCGVASNSSSNSSIIVNNNGSINGPVTTVGNWSLSNNATLGEGPNTAHAAAQPDPYANVQMQTPPACTGQSGTGSNNITRNLTPGHFCSGFNFSNNVTLNLAPGTYYVDQQMVIGNNVTVNGTGGVTLVVNGNYGISFGNNASINLTAPTTGNYAGLAIFGSRTATSSITQTFSNNTTTAILGAVYFPNQTISCSNNATITPTGCTQMIGRIINFGNNAELDNSCIGTGVVPIASSRSQLVE